MANQEVARTRDTTRQTCAPKTCKERDPTWAGGLDTLGSRRGLEQGCARQEQGRILAEESCARTPVEGLARFASGVGFLWRASGGAVFPGKSRGEGDQKRQAVFLLFPRSTRTADAVLDEHITGELIDFSVAVDSATALFWDSGLVRRPVESRAEQCVDQTSFDRTRSMDARAVDTSRLQSSLHGPLWGSSARDSGARSLMLEQRLSADSGSFLRVEGPRQRWIFGDVFTRRCCVKFDVGKHRWGTRNLDGLTFDGAAGGTLPDVIVDSIQAFWRHKPPR